MQSYVDMFDVHLGIVNVCVDPLQCFALFLMFCIVKERSIDADNHFPSWGLRSELCETGGSTSATFHCCSLGMFPPQWRL